MNILFLGDIVGPSGCKVVEKNLKKIVEKKKVDFVVANGENAAKNGVGITKDILELLLNSGINVITTGNHVWDHKETLNLIEEEDRLLRPLNLIGTSPGRGFCIYKISNELKIGILNLMGNVFMKKSENVFKTAENFLKSYSLKKDFDFLIVDIHCETTSEKMAIGHFFDNKATLVSGTHTHVPTNDARILKGGTAYITDSGMCGDYDSVIGMDKNNSLNRFFNKDSAKHYPALGEGSLSGVFVECCEKTGLANKVENIILGGVLKDTY
tara:strand:+ start:2496 stop:3302 length:807 start_codon:yes stop_codon:yes gene_type:complete